MNAPIELLPTWPLLYAISIKTGLFHVTCLTAVVQEKKKKGPYQFYCNLVDTAHFSGSSST